MHFVCVEYFCDEPVAFCGVYHATTDEAQLCTWEHQPGLRPAVRRVAGTEASTPLAEIEMPRVVACVHLVHPEECARCIFVRRALDPCPHLGDKWTCPRCLFYEIAELTLTEFVEPVDAEEA